MFIIPMLTVLMGTAEAASLKPGDHRRTLQVDERSRSYLIHVPAKYDPKRPTPVVLVFHGAGTNAKIMMRLCGINETSDKAGFIVVYANGTGWGGIFLTFNSGGFPAAYAATRPNDVKYVQALLDDLKKVVHVDPKRVYATGLSNGGMMSYRLASELSDRIAAIAPVAGTLCIEKPTPKRPVPLMHIHGTADRIVPWSGSTRRNSGMMSFKSVDDTIGLWLTINRCQTTPVETKFEDKFKDGTTVSKKTFLPKDKSGAEVVLVTVKGGGHTWPGRVPPVSFIGRSTMDISANELIWEFFKRHRLP